MKYAFFWLRVEIISQGTISITFSHDSHCYNRLWPAVKTQKILSLNRHDIHVSTIVVLISRKKRKMKSSKNRLFPFLVVYLDKMNLPSEILKSLFKTKKE